MWWCQPNQLRTSYSSKATRLFCSSNSVSIGHRLIATWASLSPGVSAGALEKKDRGSVPSRLALWISQISWPGWR